MLTPHLKVVDHHIDLTNRSHAVLLQRLDNRPPDAPRKLRQIQLRLVDCRDMHIGRDGGIDAAYGNAADLGADAVCRGGDAGSGYPRHAGNLSDRLRDDARKRDVARPALS